MNIKKYNKHLITTFMKKTTINNYLYTYFKTYKIKEVLLNKIKTKMIVILELFFVMYIFIFGNLNYRYKILKSLKDEFRVIEEKIIKSYEIETEMVNYLEKYKKIIKNKKLYINQILGQLNSNSFIIESIISRNYLIIFRILNYIINFFIYNLLNVLTQDIIYFIFYYDYLSVDKKSSKT